MWTDVFWRMMRDAAMMRHMAVASLYPTPTNYALHEAVVRAVYGW